MILLKFGRLKYYLILLSPAGVFGGNCLDEMARCFLGEPLYACDYVSFGHPVKGYSPFGTAALPLTGARPTDNAPAYEVVQ